MSIGAALKTSSIGLIEKYPLRTWRHPPVEEIFLPSYPFL